MIGYSIFNKSINGIKSISDGITIIENGVVTANDIKGQIKDKQNNFQIGDNLTVDQNLQVDNISTLNQVFVDGTDLNAFMLTVDSLLNDPDHTNPFLANVIFAGTATFANNAIYLNNTNFQVYKEDGTTSETFPTNKLLFLKDMSGSTIQTQLNDKPSLTIGTNTFNNFNIFHDYAEFNYETYFDSNIYCNANIALRDMTVVDYFAPGIHHYVSNAALGRIGYLENVNADISALISDRVTFDNLYSYVALSTVPKANITDVDNALALKADTTYVNSQLALKANITYVDTEISTALSGITFSGSLEAPTSTDLVISLTTPTNNIIMADNTVFQEKVTFQNGQDPCSNFGYIADTTFTTVEEIPKYVLLFGGKNITLPVPPATGINNGYEVTIIKVINTNDCIISCGSAVINTSPTTSVSSYAMTENVLKLVSLNSGQWYKI